MFKEKKRKERLPWEQCLAMASFWSEETKVFLSRGDWAIFFAINGGVVGDMKNVMVCCC